MVVLYYLGSILEFILTVTVESTTPTCTRTSWQTKQTYKAMVSHVKLLVLYNRLLLTVMYVHASCILFLPQHITMLNFMLFKIQTTMLTITQSSSSFMYIVHVY